MLQMDNKPIFLPPPQRLSLCARTGSACKAVHTQRRPYTLCLKAIDELRSLRRNHRTAAQHCLVGSVTHNALRSSRC